MEPERPDRPGTGSKPIIPWRRGCATGRQASGMSVVSSFVMTHMMREADESVSPWRQGR